MKIFINETPFDTAEGSTVRDAVTRFDPDLGRHLETGRAFVTDGVGRTLSADAAVFPGAIYRVVGSARGPGATR